MGPESGEQKEGQGKEEPPDVEKENEDTEEEKGRQVRATRAGVQRRRKGRTGRRRRAVADGGVEKNPWTSRLKQWQKHDPTLQTLSKWEERPKWEEVAGAPTEVKYYWSRWKQLKREDGMWQIKWYDPGGIERWKIIVPSSQASTILHEHHDRKMAGHFGTEKTVQRIRMSPYFWPRLRTTVEDWCQECEVCARTKSENQQRRAPLQPYHVGAPLERIGVDILGPLTVTNQGNRFILVVGDYWTKWMEAYPIPDHTAPTVAQVLVQRFFSQFGLPRQIHSDQGREFESNLFQELCQMLEIDKTRTTPWHPSSNGMVERFNKTLAAMLRQMCSEHQRDWDEHVALATMAYRASVHETTGATPNRMMLGRELPMPSHLLAAPPAGGPLPHRGTSNS